MEYDSVNVVSKSRKKLHKLLRTEQITYAYLDHIDVLHITNYKDRAKGHYVQTDLASVGGYPVDENGHPYILYSPFEEKRNRIIPKELSNLYKALSIRWSAYDYDYM